VSLKTRFLLLTSVLIMCASLGAWLVFQQITSGIIEQWGRHLAEVQVRYDSARLLQPLEREIALARQMADSKVIQRWARNPNQPELHTQAIAELESFRGNFRDHSYFVGLLGTGNYYHNNAKNEFDGRWLRYQLKPDNPDDAWFYRLIEQNHDFHLNINPDAELGVTKLWIDVLIRDGSEVLGIVGTGLALDDFLQEIVDLNQPGITTLFVDQNGAIQLHRDPAKINYANIVKPEGQKILVDQLFDSEEDSAHVRYLMQQLKGSKQEGAQVISDFVTVDGKSNLAGIAYLPSIGWYEITLMDLNVLMPLSGFMPMILLFAAIVVLSLLIMALALQKQVLKPLNALERAMQQLQDGELTPAELPSANGELGRLNAHFVSMAEAVRYTTIDLEEKIRERTEALQRLARLDPLTGLINRRGMTELLNEVAAKADREHQHFGLIWLDVDKFKEINDLNGHAIGDQVLKYISQVLLTALRPYDHASRWGGDEFLVMLSPCTDMTLQRLGDRIRETIEQGAGDLQLQVTVSMGGYLAGPGDTVDTALQQADEALYAAKHAGRNRFEITHC